MQVIQSHSVAKTQHPILVESQKAETIHNIVYHKQSNFEVWNFIQPNKSPLWGLI